MLLALRSLWEGGILPPIPAFRPAQSVPGIWLVWKHGHGWYVETAIGHEKVVHLQQVIDAARRIGATIKFLD